MFEKSLHSMSVTVPDDECTMVVITAPNEDSEPTSISIENEQLDILISYLEKAREILQQREVDAGNEVPGHSRKHKP